MSEQQFLDALPLLERLIAYTCRRNGMFGAEAEDFGSWLKVRIIEKDYAIFRKFEQRSSLKSYLSIVVQNLFRDYRISSWGKWRPSAVARRLGPYAVQLDTLIWRDGLSVQEAVATIRSESEAAPEPQELEEIASNLPVRLRPRAQGENGLAHAQAQEDSGYRVAAGELAPEARRLQEALGRHLAELCPRDQLVLRMHYREEIKWVEIAEVLGLDPKHLYPRVQRVLLGLRQALEREQVSWSRVAELLDWGFEPDVQIGDEADSLGDESVSPSEEPSEEVVSR
ncbi:MAG TPA: sigma-70 family RNA polymerase sigma factor [Thermoanaerobaculia bacterium]|nr:sigma-70 family RNA polymerase sigma factor [Thermoanaerobaculia bacterium]